MPALPALTVIRSKLKLAATVPLLCPADVQARNTLVHPWMSRLMLPPVVVLKVPEPVVDVHEILGPSVVVRFVVALEAILKVVVALRCKVSANAIVGRAKNAALTTPSASTIIFLLISYLSFAAPRKVLYVPRAFDRGPLIADL